MNSAIQMTRRRLLQASLGTGALQLLPQTMCAEETAGLSMDPRRPQFHLLPVHNWMNDPNGPIYFNGKYHMFFQYNPKSAVWGNMSWNHAISDDMVHWKNYPVAFTMTPDGPDAAGCFSGSAIATMHDGKPRVYALYTGVVRDKVNETIRNEGLRESQCLAWSDDALLRTWTKLEQPVIPSPPSGMKIVGFRDPVVWKQGDLYYMAVVAGIEKTGGCLLLYRSKNLHEWQYLHPLVTGEWNGHPTANPVDDGEMWECPDFFELNGRHVLIYSTLRKVYWKSGVLDKESMIFEEQRSGILDLGSFYAPKSQVDARGNRILWAWLPEKRSQEEMLKAGWSGMIGLPRVLTLDRDGILQMDFLPDLQGLRRSSIRSNAHGYESNLTIPGATGELLCQGSREAEWTIQMKLPNQAVFEVKYDPVRHAFQFENHELPLQVEDIPSMHAFFDGSVVEMLFSRRHGLTRRFYYAGNTAPSIPVKVSGVHTQMKGWTLAPISADRLTSSTV